MNRRGDLFVAIVLGAVVFISGFLSYPLLVQKGTAGPAEGVPIGGYFVIKAYHADGTLFATWQGHNSLTANGVSDLAQCMSGQDLPPNLGTCEGPLNLVWVYGGGNGPIDTGDATNTLYPSGCNPDANPGTCTGWVTKGTISFTSGTYPYTVNQAGTEGVSGLPFDIVNIAPITVNQGDTLSVTVTFTIS